MRSSTTMDADAQSPDRARTLTIVALLLALFVGLALHGAATKSETYDEPLTLLAGWAYVQTGDLSFNREHPPLAKWLMGLSLLAIDPVLPQDYQNLPAPAYVFLTGQPHLTPAQILFWGRLPGIALGVVLLLYVRRWASRAFGEPAGLVALALAATNPNLIALSRVAGNDFGLTVFAFAASYHAWRWLSAGGSRSLALCSVMLGCALGTKLTALMLLPPLGLTVLAVTLARRRVAVLGGAVLALVCAVGVVWMIYLGEARSLGEAREHARFVPRGQSETVFYDPRVEQAATEWLGDEFEVPLLSYAKAFDHQIFHAQHGHFGYFMGEVTAEGHPAFFVVTGLLKNPEGLVLLVLLGLLAWRRGPGLLNVACLAGFPLVMLIVFSRSDVQLGFKYMLPAVPFLCVAAGQVLAAGRDGTPAGKVSARGARGYALFVAAAGVGLALAFDEPDSGGWRGALPLLLAPAWALWVTWRSRGGGSVSMTAPVVALALWAGADSLSRHPHQLAYFNGWAGGPDGGTWYSVLGDDWGQDTALLGRWMNERGVDEIVYDAYSTAEPEAWGVHHRPSHLTDGKRPPPVGLFAVHVTMQRRLPGVYAFLDEHEPVAILGHTIRVYDLPEP